MSRAPDQERAPDAEQASAADDQLADGQSIDGQSIDGQSIDGQSADGSSAPAAKPRWWAALAAFLAPSLAAGAVGAAAIGLFEGAQASYTALEAFAAAGYLAMIAVPIGLAGSLLVRGLWRGWGASKVVASLTEDTGGAPRLAAWTAFAIAGCWLAAFVMFNALQALQRATSTRAVVSLAGALIAAATAGALMLVSRPTVTALAAGLRTLDRAIARRLRRSLMTPALIAAGTLTVGALVLVAAWLISVRPRVGHLDIGWVYYVIGFVAAVAATHVALRRIPARARRFATGGAIGLAAALIATAVWTRHARPYTMLEVWGNTELAGNAIDVVYDLSDLRGELRLAEFRPTPQPGAQHPDIVLITVDTLRADRTPLHGGRSIMPTLSRLAHSGAVFEWAFAPGNVTRRSVPSIVLGVNPARVHGRVAGWALRLDPRHVTLAERLRAAGYDTAGFFCCESQFGPRHRLGLIRGVDHLVLERDGQQLATQAVEWIQARDDAGVDRPMFVWLHFIEPHLWEKDYPIAQHGTDVRRRYDKSLIETDRFLRVLSPLWTPKRRARTVVILTSDHGEGLGDHGQRNHSTDLYNSQIHVPLVILGPGIQSKRIEQPVSLNSVAPTALDLAGFVPPGMPQMDGRSLAPLVRGEVADDPDTGEAVSLMIRDRSVKHGMRALIWGRYKYIERDGTDRLELYDLRADTREKRNLATEQPLILERMRERMQEHRAVFSVSPF